MKTLRLIAFVTLKIIAITLSTVGVLIAILGFGALAFASPILAGASVIIGSRRR